MKKQKKELAPVFFPVIVAPFAELTANETNQKMSKKQYRQQVIAQRRALSPRLFRQYARKIVTPRGFALLEQIHAEIAPRIPAEILPDIVPPVVRFASRRKGEAQAAQGESRFALSGGEFEHSIGIYDRDEMAGGEERELAPVLPVEPKEKEASE